MKKKIVYIAPHLSTGGLPQYLFKQIESMVNDFDVYCIEWDNVTGGVLVVQRNRIQNILKDKLITLGQTKDELFAVLGRIQPDVIHLQEIPEMFMPEDVADKLYSLTRPYVIIETSHDSSYDVDQKRYFPDKFLMVSNYQVDAYKKLGVPVDLVEYPIELKTRTKTREEALRDLGLDPNLKHVINVGLFTPRKNQAEVVEYARQLVNYPIQFHFIGNQADNFKHYWEPLMQNFPNNCKWWGERSDVDKFYEAADLFLFTSKGNSHDKETMPLVIREALSWKTPSLIYNLPVYMGYFDKYNTIEYLKDDIRLNVYRIAEKLLRDAPPEFIIEIPVNLSTTIPSPKFTSNWDLDTQTIHYSTDIQVDYPILASLKEYKSDAVLWSTVLNTMSPNVDYWMIPISKEYLDYSKDPNFTGVKLCMYDNRTGQQLYEMPFVSKFVDIPTVTLSNHAPYRMNYMEFYIDKKYERWIGKPYGLVIDVGANIGVFTKYMLDNEYANHVVSIECGQLALEDLQKNFKRNPWVTIIPKALHYKNEQITFYQSDANSLISSILSPSQLTHHNAGKSGDNAYSVDSITLGDLAQQYNTIDLLKMDIEGAEYDIILNTDAAVFTNIKNIFIECHFFENNYQHKYDSMLARLRVLGYTVEEYTPNQSTYAGTSECIFATKYSL
jgi:FkbM family methyltransferase